MELHIFQSRPVLCLLRVGYADATLRQSERRTERSALKVLAHRPTTVETSRRNEAANENPGKRRGSSLGHGFAVRADLGALAHFHNGVSNGTTKTLWANITAINVSNALPRVDLHDATEAMLSPGIIGSFSIGIIADYAQGPYRVRIVMAEEIK